MRLSFWRRQFHEAYGTFRTTFSSISYVLGNGLWEAGTRPALAGNIPARLHTILSREGSERGEEHDSVKESDVL